MTPLQTELAEIQTINARLDTLQMNLGVGLLTNRFAEKPEEERFRIQAQVRSMKDAIVALNRVVSVLKERIEVEKG